MQGGTINKDIKMLYEEYDTNVSRNRINKLSNKSEYITLL